MNSSITAIVFDIGNVLLKFDYTLAADRLKQKNSLTQLPDRDEVVEIKNLYESGRLTREEFLARVRPLFADLGTDEEFMAIWADIFEVNEPMVEFVQQVAGRVPIYLLSNIGCIHLEHIRRQYAFFQQFDGGVFSYQVTCAKPEPEIYVRATESLRLEPSTTLFIDDLPENIEEATRQGWRGLRYQFQKHADFLSAVRRLGLTD